MKKRFLFVVATVALLSASALAQWDFVRAYTPFRSPLKPNDLWGAHGLVVDPEGKIWVAPYDATDTVTNGGGTLQKRREIFVFRPDGSRASFSPIKAITVGGVTDSLNNDNTGRGLAPDHQGNILYSSFDRIFRINYRTGVGMARVATQGAAASITAAAADSVGNVFVSRVAGAGGSVKIYDASLTFLGNALDTGKSFSRTLLVSRDGKDLYYAVFNTLKVWVYRNDFGPGFGTYAFADTILRGLQVESMAWQPRPGRRPRLWVSSGSRNNPPDAPWRTRSWYGYDLDLRAVVDSILWGATFPGNPSYDDTVIVAQSPRPRGIGFTTSGDTAYVAMYLADSNSVKMFKRRPSSVDPDPTVTPTSFTLSQNYPNPFNPSTTIRFTMNQSGFATLKVFNMLGEEVATIVNGQLDKGAYITGFDASSLPSGTYLYRLTASGQSISKKMMLVK